MKKNHERDGERIVYSNADSVILAEQEQYERDVADRCRACKSDDTRLLAGAVEAEGHKGGEVIMLEGDVFECRECGLVWMDEIQRPRRATEHELFLDAFGAAAENLEDWKATKDTYYLDRAEHEADSWIEWRAENPR